MKFKLGETVRITSKETHHEFDIGQLVTVVGIKKELIGSETQIAYECEGYNGNWHIKESEAETIHRNEWYI